MRYSHVRSGDLGPWPDNGYWLPSLREHATNYMETHPISQKSCFLEYSPKPVERGLCVIERSFHVLVRRNQYGRLVACLRGFEMECIMECCRRVEMESVSFFVEKLDLFVTRQWDQGHWNYSYCIFIPRYTLIPSLNPVRMPTLLPVSLESLDPSVISPQWKLLLRGGNSHTLHLPSPSVERLINHLHSFSSSTPIQSRFFLLLRVHGGVITFSSLQDETPTRRIIIGSREYQALYVDQSTKTLIPCILTRCRYESLPWTTQNVIESDDGLHLSQCYYIQHLNHFVINNHEYYVITEQSIIHHGVLKDLDNLTSEGSLSSVASLLSNIPQYPCTQGDYPCEVCSLHHDEYHQIQTAYINDLFHGLVFTPSFLLSHLHTISDAFWLLGLFVDSTPINESGKSRIRLQDLTSDIVIQLSCEEWIERFPLGSILCVTNLLCTKEDRIVLSKYSSFFCIPQTTFLQSILPHPLTLSYPLSSFCFTWQVVDVELVLSFRAYSICNLCQRPVVNNCIHSEICRQGTIDKSVIFVELSFLGSCGITKVKGLLRGECVWVFLHVSDEERDAILKYVRDVGCWCEWKSPDTRQALIMGDLVEEEEMMEREMKDMFIWEQGVEMEMNQKPVENRTDHIRRFFGPVNMLCKKQSDAFKPNSNVIWKELPDCILEYTVMDPILIDVINVHFEDTISQLLRSLS